MAMNTSQRSAGSFLNILYVEDSETDIEAVRRALDEYGGVSCQVWQARSMAAAEDILESTPVDLILLDLGLPDTSGGQDTFNRINKHKKAEAPVIILTSVNDQDLAVSLVDGGAQDYVRKSTISAEPQLLRDAITFAIHRHSSLRAKEHQLEEKENIIQWITGSYSVMK